MTAEKPLSPLSERWKEYLGGLWTQQEEDFMVELESLVENLHRLDLTDIERENAVHGLWEKRKDLGIESQAELSHILGVSPEKISADIEAWEARHNLVMPMGMDVSTRTISHTRGLEPEIRKRVVEKVSKGQYGAAQVDTVSKVIRQAPEPIKRELVREKPRITPEVAEIIIDKLTSKEDQEAVFKEAVQHRLTQDEVESRILDIKRSREKGIAPVVDRQIIIEGQWLVDRIRNPATDLLSINPDAFNELNKAQKEDLQINKKEISRGDRHDVLLFTNGVDAVIDEFEQAIVKSCTKADAEGKTP